MTTIAARHAETRTDAPEDTYALGRGEAETRRLILQHQVYGPITRRVFEAAGIGRGMRVLDAGLPAPELRLEAAIGGGPDWPGYEIVAETLRSLLPALQRMTGLDPAEVDVDTLAERLRAEAVAGRLVQLLPITVGAWARVTG